MFSWNVMTPYYSEDSIYTKGDLEQHTDAFDVWTLLYLQTLFRTDWNNFLESYQYMMKKVLIHCIKPEIWRRIKIQKWMIPINLYIATLTLLHILLISDSIVLEPLPSIPSCLKVTDVEVYNKDIVPVSLGTLFLEKVILKTKNTPSSLLDENSFKPSIWIRKDIWGSIEDERCLLGVCEETRTSSNYYSWSRKSNIYR